jgi:hypothetical protein
MKEKELNKLKKEKILNQPCFGHTYHEFRESPDYTRYYCIYCLIEVDFDKL